MSFDSSAFHRFIIENDVIGFFEQPITLKSGKKSNWYVNWRTVSGDAFLIDRLTDFIVQFVDHHNFNPDCIYGVPEGATKTAILATYKMVKSRPDFEKGRYSLPMGRAKIKEHGVARDRFFVGAPAGRTIVLEDVTTTGSSLFSSVDQLLESQIDIIGAISLSNRMEKREDGLQVKDAFKKKYSAKIPYLAMSQASDLLPLAMEKLKPRAAIVRSIQRELKEGKLS